MRTIALVVLAMLLLVGCGPRKEKYNVWLKNDTKSPLTIGFTKDGGPDQDLFMPPEFLAQDPNVDPVKTSWGVLVGPGKPIDLKEPVVALFDREGAQAYLRVYRGNMNLVDLCSTSRGNPDRLDLVLVPGDNRFTITDKDGPLRAVKQ